MQLNLFRNIIIRSETQADESEKLRRALSSHLLLVAAARLWNSIPSHVTAAPLSPFSAVVLDHNHHISSHFIISLSGSSLICAVPAQRLVILKTNR